MTSTGPASSPSVAGRSRTSTYVYRYQVTASEVPEYRIGQVLVDKRRDLVKTWTIFTHDTGDLREFTAERGPRCCSECHGLGLVRDYGHDGEHGKAAPYTPWPESDGAGSPAGASGDERAS